MIWLQRKLFKVSYLALVVVGASVDDIRAQPDFEVSLFYSSSQTWEGEHCKIACACSTVLLSCNVRE